MSKYNDRNRIFQKAKTIREARSLALQYFGRLVLELSQKVNIPLIATPQKNGGSFDIKVIIV